MNKKLMIVALLCLNAASLMAGDIENKHLIDAINHNDVAGVQEAIEQHADINARSDNGSTPLHMAVLIPDSKTRKEIITRLVRNGARVDLPNNAGQLPTDLARTMPDFGDVQELLGVGSCPVCLADITPKDDFVRGSELFGCDPRHIVHRTCLFDDAGRRLTAICPICRKTQDTHTAHTEREALMFHHFVQQETGGTFTQQAAPASTIPAINLQLINAAYAGNLAHVQASLAQGADINAYSEIGWTALIEAARNGHTHVVAALLAHPGIDVNVRDLGTGITALIVAAYNGHTQIVAALLAHPDINVNVHVFGGQTALIDAARNGHTQIVTALLAHPNINLNENLIEAARAGNLMLVQTLLAQGADVNAHGRFGNTALIRAAQEGHTQIATALLAHPNINVNARDDNGITALMWAARRGNANMTTALLAHPDIDINTLDNEGKTALIWAREREHENIACMLIEHGAR